MLVLFCSLISHRLKFRLQKGRPASSKPGFTMSELVEKLAEQYDWSPSVPNLSDKLRRESLRYREAVELADALGYDLVWQKRR